MYRSNVVEIFVGFIVLIAAIFIGIVTFNKLPYKNTYHSCYTIKASFTNIEGLEIGDDVTISGVKIGSVTSISLNKDFNPIITMCIQKNILLPLDSSASLYISNLLGKKHIDITPGSSKDMIHAGGLIEYTNSGLNINDIISKLINSFIK